MAKAYPRSTVFQVVSGVKIAFSTEEDLWYNNEEETEQVEQALIGKIPEQRVA